MSTRLLTYCTAGVALIIGSVLLQTRISTTNKIRGLLDVLETPSRAMDTNRLQATTTLSDLLKSPINRSSEVRRRLMALAQEKDYAFHNSAFDCLTQFKNDPQVRLLFINTLHNNLDETTRGKMTARLLINAGKDKAVLPELKIALAEPNYWLQPPATSFGWTAKSCGG